MQVFTSLLVLSIFFSVYIINDIKSYKQRKVSNMLSMVQVIGNNSISTIQFNDNEEAKKILSELKNVSPDIIQATILDKTGNVFASYKRASAGDLQIPASLNSKKYAFTDNHLLVETNIIKDNEFLGTVILETDLAELQQIKKSKYNQAVLLSLIALFFSFLVANVVQVYISKRLLKLVNTMKEVSVSGDYSKTIKDGGKDEVSVLTDVFNNLMQQIKENQQRKDEFIGIVSHELKTPLTSIKGYLDLLNLIEEKEPNRQFVQKSLGNVNKLENLIKDLLDVSKIQSGQLKLNPHEFNINQLLNETIASIQMVSSTHELMRKGNFENENIVADKVRIEQVVTNLLSNAIKYSPGENKVIVAAKKKDNDVIVQIRDFGIGVPKEEQLNIFERFYRTKGTSETITGFGLGLYICRDIIARHNGKIWVEAEDKGSSFYFSLPLNGKEKI